MEGLLNPAGVSNSKNGDSAIVPLETRQAPVASSRRLARSPEDALEILRSQPSLEELHLTLNFLTSSEHGVSFSIHAPGPLATQILNVLVTSIVPDFWAVLERDSHVEECRLNLLTCLQGVNGIGAVLASLKSLCVEKTGGDRSITEDTRAGKIKILATVLGTIIGSSTFSFQMWQRIIALQLNKPQQELLWGEYVTLSAQGRITSVVAQAYDSVKGNRDIPEELWLSQGGVFAAWLGANIAYMVSSLEANHADAWRAVTALCSKSFSLGYNDIVVQQLVDRLALHDSQDRVLLHHLLLKLPASHQRSFLLSTLKLLSRRLSKHELGTEPSPVTTDPVARTVAATAALLSGFLRDNDLLKELLASLLLDDRALVIESMAARRASLACIRNDEDETEQLLGRMLERFADKIHIKHTPIMQQEVLAQNLLMTAGYVHRERPMALRVLARSSPNLQGMSNRLSASTTRARVLGMIVGSAISNLVDTGENRLVFDLEEVQTPEADWYRGLLLVDDRPSKDIEVHLLKDPSAPLEPWINAPSSRGTETKPTKLVKSNATRGSSNSTQSKVEVVEAPTSLRIQELVDEDEDLVPYAKPDSDPEDEEEDPTLVNRQKPTAPVYIRDLISGLRDTENYDRQKLAVTTSAHLIRRKAGFGKEVTDHVNELLTVLVGMSNNFEIEGFEALRLQALIAVVTTQPKRVGPNLAKALFDGDYSMAQRAIILTTLGLGAREVAGLQMEDGDLGSASKPGEAASPTKMLPGRLHEMYSAAQSPVNAIAERLERTMIEPVALNAADKATGPNVLKVRTFSSRLEVEKKRKKPVANELAKIVGESFFFPLTGHWWMHLQAYGQSNVHFSSFLLTTYIKTLSLIMHAAGTSPLSLPQMTAEFWDILLSVRTVALDNVSVLEAVLFGLLTLLDVNLDHRQLVQEHSKELIETQEWCEMIFEKTPEGDEEGNRIKMFAASVLLRSKGIADKYQRLLLGDLVSR